MLAYPHSPVDSMAQLVPCSGGFMSPQQQQQQQEFYSCKSSSGGLGGPAPSSAPVLVDISVYAGSCGGQSVPSSPTFSTYNNSPPSYWSESPTVVKSEPYSSNPLDDLWDDISFESSLSVAPVAAPVKSEGHSLLIECLRPSSNESQLEYLNQIGSQVIGTQQDMNCQSSTFLSTLSIKTEESNGKSYNCWANPPIINPNPAVQGLRGVLGLIMEEVNEEVRTTCEILGLSPNPSQWTVQDVNAWLHWMSRKYELGPFPLERFDMEGAALASLTEEEFRTRAPQGGDTIYAKLDIWRSAWNQHKAIQLQQLQQQQVSPTSPPATHPIPTIQVDEPAPADINDFLSCWINDTHQDLQQPNMLSASNQQHLLCVHPVSPASVTSSSLRGALSPYSDHSGISCSEDMASEVEEMEDEEEAMLNRMGDSSERSASAASSRAAASPNGSHIHLWQFLKELLSQPTVHGSAIRWLDRTRGVFKIEDSVRVARLWGKRKNRPAMNYDKLSRSIRQYYRKGIMKKTERSQRLVYQFCHPYAL